MLPRAADEGRHIRGDLFIVQAVIVDFLYAQGTVTDEAQGVLHSLEALGKPQALFHFQQLLLGALDAVAHALACDVLVLGNFSQGDPRYSRPPPPRAACR